MLQNNQFIMRVYLQCKTICIDAACFRTQYVGSSSTNVDFITFLESREERITIFEDKQGRDFNVKGVI